MESWEDSEEGQCAALFRNSNEDVKMAMHGDDFVSSETSTNFSNPKDSAKSMGTLGFEDSDVKSLLLLNRVFRVGTDQTGQYLDINT